MNRKHIAVLAAIPLVLTGLAACGGDDSDAASSSSAPPATYDSVVELKNAAVEAGYTCTSWKQDDRVQNAAQSGQCSDSDVFSTYLTSDAVQSTITGLKSLGSGVHVLAGENWIINAPSSKLPALRDELGGTIVKAPATTR